MDARPGPAWELPPPGQPAIPAPEGTTDGDADPSGAAADRPRRPIAWSGVAAALVFLVAATGVLGTWVSGETPEADGPVGSVIDLAGFDPGEQVTYKGLDIPGLGAAAAALALGGAALALVGVALRRPVLFLSTSGAAGAVAALAGLSVMLLAWLEIDNVPFSSYIPSDVRAQIPDPDVGAGLWVFFAGASIGAVLCATAAVTSYRDRYGVRQAAPGPHTAPGVAAP